MPVRVRGEALDLVDCALCGVATDVGVVVMGKVREMVMDNLYGMTTGTESRPTWPFGPGTGLLQGARVRLVTWTWSDSDPNIVYSFSFLFVSIDNILCHGIISGFLISLLFVH